MASSRVPLDADPRGRTEAEWLEVLDFLVAALGEATSARPELGRYWISDHAGHASAGVGARVRAKGPLPGIASDAWEAALCLDGDAGGAWVDAYVFPFSNGSAMTPRGRLADLGPNAMVTEHLQLALEGDRFTSMGWTHPDGPGEWGWVKEPGSVSVAHLTCTPVAATFAGGAPILVDLRLGDALNRARAHDAGRGTRDDARVSLLYVERAGDDQTDLARARVARGEATPAQAQRVNGAALAKGEPVRVALADLAIQGGWRPGRYRVALRLQNDDASWSWSSEISAPFDFSIT